MLGRQAPRGRHLGHVLLCTLRSGPMPHSASGPMLQGCPGRDRAAHGVDPGHVVLMTPRRRPQAPGSWNGRRRFTADALPALTPRIHATLSLIAPTSAFTRVHDPVHALLYGDHLSHDGTLPWAAGIYAIRERFQQVAAIVPANLDGFRKKAQLSELYARKRPRPTCAAWPARSARWPGRAGADCVADHDDRLCYPVHAVPQTPTSRCPGEERAGFPHEAAARRRTGRLGPRPASVACQRHLNFDPLAAVGRESVMQEDSSAGSVHR
jgi:hypothetical protein